MSIVANFDINLRGNTQSVDAAADKTGARIADLRAAVDKHGSGISAKFGELGDKMRSAFAALPGAGVITAVLSPAVYLGGAIGKAFSSSVTGIMSATSAVGAFGAATTIATGGLNLILAAVAAAGAAAIGAGMAWTGMGMASMGGIKEAQKAADKLGMSVEAVQGFAFKSRLDVDELSGVMLKFERNLAGGSEKANKMFAQLGLDREKLRAKGLESAILDTADAFARIDDKVGGVAASFDLFGKQGTAALKLLEGGSAGIAQSLAEAKALGAIVSISEAKQVAEAAGALKMMKQAMGGLGKTAAITIAPFVKMIANGLTEAMKWVNSYREQIIDFAYGVEFAFKNFGEYVKLYTAKATLYLTEFGNFTIHLCTDVLPQLFKSFGEMLHEGLTTGFAGGFDKAWNKAVADIKRSMTRESGEIETDLRRRLDAFEKDLDARKKKFLEEKKAALNIPEPGESKVGGGSKDNAAVQRGSVEAFKIIAGDQGDKMFKVQNDQLEVARKTYELLKKKQAKRGPELIDVGRV